MSCTWFQDLPRPQKETHMQVCESKFGLFPLCLQSTQNHTGSLLFSLFTLFIFCTNEPNAFRVAQAFRTECPSSSYRTTELGIFEILSPQFEGHRYGTMVVHDFTLKSFHLS